MSTNRIQRINEEIHRELSDLLRQLKDPRVNGLVSITGVEATGDLRYAKIFVSVLEKAKAADVSRGLNSAAGFLRRELAARLSLRYTPQLIFTVDDSIGRGAHILEIMNKLEGSEDGDERK